MFLNQYFKSLKLKTSKIKDVKYQDSDWSSLVDNSEFFDFVVQNTDFKEGNIVIFDKEVSLEGIDWNRDYLNNFPIKNDYYFNLREWIIRNSFKGFDIKNVWELSRGYYLVDLASQYCKTKDEKYLKQYQNIVKDWIGQNPYLHSSNWTNPMEVSIRVVNWITSFQMINRDGVKLNEEFLSFFYNHMNLCFNFLINNIETYPFKSNHYLVDNFGILVLSLFLKSKEKWIQKSFNNLLKAEFSQFDSDGVDFENSSNYQILKTETLMMAFLLYKQNLNKLESVLKVEDRHLEQLSKIYEFSILLFKNESDTFSTGDNDETELLKMPILKAKLEKLYYLMFGDKVDQKNSKIYFKSGYGFLRNSKFNILFLRANNTRSSHFHNDLLSFQLVYTGKDFFVDSNTFNYNLNSAKRISYLRTQGHNTCFINQSEQSMLESGDSFLRNTSIRSFCKKSNISNVRDEMTLEARYKGFTHLRSLVFNKEQNKLSIFDTFNGKVRSIEWNLFCPKEVKIYNNLTLKNVLVLENDGQKLVLELPETLSYVLSNAFISKKYNVEEIGTNIKLKFENKNNISNLSFQIVVKENYLN